MAGTKNSQKLSKASYVEFPTYDIGRPFLAAAGGKGKRSPFGSGTLLLKAAKTKVHLRRGWALRKAEELVKGTMKGDIKIDFKSRSVNVNGASVFSQDADELEGNFSGACAHLKLP